MRLKLYLLAAFLMFALVTSAQRAAVLEFKANVGVSQNDVDGISAIFITYFQPTGYTMVERTQIDKVIDEQGLQRGNLTEAQMVRIGEILNVSKIVVGDVNIVMGQYNVDVRAINVESGTIATTEGATFTDSYRASMQTIAQNLAKKIAISPGPIVQSEPEPEPTPQPSNEVITIWGYLHIFPTDLGSFKEVPNNVIDRINDGVQYGYCTWRIPTNEELSLMQSNDILPRGETYISSDGSKSGKVRLVTDEGKCSEMKADIEKLKQQGVVSGVFSSGSGSKIYFSKGNLQYQASTNTWRFAEHQWDIIGDANKNISSSYSGWIDLFGWGTSGYNGKNPWMTSTTSTAYGNGDRDIAGTNYDWGVYNSISNGGGKSWRTLTRDEWVYLFNTRSTSSGIRYAKATVNGVHGVILLPDNWRSSVFSLSNTNNNKASYNSNIIGLSTWINKFETNGAVFLPAAGYRGGTSVDGVGAGGNYWSASYSNSDGARPLWFNDEDLGPDGWSDRKYGRSVRLVCPVEN